MGLFFKLVALSLRSQMQYRASFFMYAISHFFSTFIDIFGIWILFDRFKMIQGWTFPELALIYGIMQMGFSIAEATARSFDTFGEVIKRGEFDRILLRPVGTIVQIASREMHFMRVGRFFQGLVVLLWGCQQVGMTLFSTHVMVIIFSIIGAASLFYGLLLIQATLSFWTIETMEIMNILTYGGLQTAQYPITIYGGFITVFFTFIIPIACVSYYPIASILGKGDVSPWLGFIAPFTGIIFLVIACQLWKIGVRHYQSTGS